MRRVDVDHIQHALRAQPIAAAYASFGGVVQLHFGDLSERGTPRGPAKRGTYCLMVEMGEWRINRGTRCLADSNSPRNMVDVALRRLVGRSVNRASFAHPHSLITFTGSVELELYAGAGFYGGWHMSHWTLFHHDAAVLAMDYRARRLS